MSGHFFPCLFFFVCVCRSGTVGNIIPETATEQSILGIASRSSKSQQQQQSFQPGLHLPELCGERRRDANSLSICPVAIVSGPRWWATPKDDEKQTSRPPVYPSAGPSGLGPKLAVRSRKSKLPVQLRAPPPPPPGQARSWRREAEKANFPSTCVPLRRPLRARPEVNGERQRKQTPCPAERPSAAASGQGPQSAARGVESELPVQLCTPLQQPPGKARSKR